MKNKGWKILQIIQLIIFLCFSAFLFARTVDGHGTVQTLEVKLISFAIASCEGARGAWGCSPVEQFSQLPPAVLRITTLSKIAWLSAYGVLQ